MNISQQEYSSMVRRVSPNSTIVKDCIGAFFAGGLICIIGQALTDTYLLWPSGDLTLARSMTSISLVFLSAFFTVCGWYDNIAKRAGAGTLVPITGFANSVVSPAIEFQSEGFISGLGAKMFVIAGPVIVFGTLASVLYGLFLLF